MSLKDQWIKHRGALAVVGVAAGLIGGIGLANNHDPKVAALGGAIGTGCFGYAMTQKYGWRVACATTLAASAYGGVAGQSIAVDRIEKAQEAAAYNALPTLPANDASLKNAYCLDRAAGSYKLPIASVTYKFDCP